MRVAEEAKALIDTNTQEPLSLNDICTLLDVDTESLSASFRSKYKVALIDYMLMNRSGEMLCLMNDSKLRLFEIAERLDVSIDTARRGLVLHTDLNLREYRDARAAPIVANEAKAVVDQHRKGLLTVGKVAERVGISRDRLERHFKKTFSVTLVEYVKQSRQKSQVREISDAALYSTLSLEQVAQKFGVSRGAVLDTVREHTGESYYSFSRYRGVS